MRRAVALLGLALLGALAAAPAAGHPGHVPPSISITQFRFSPNTAEQYTDEATTWFWDGPDTNHSVTADPGQAEQFDSDPGRDPATINHARGASFAVRLTRPGTYGYHCKVHPSMRGSITVVQVPTGDTAPPQLFDVGVRPASVCARRKRGCRTTSVRLRLQLSEDADVIVELVPRRRGRDLVSGVRLKRFVGRYGPNVFGLSGRGLRRGLSYRVSVTAVDAAGNSSAPTNVRLRVRK